MRALSLFVALAFGPALVPAFAADSGLWFNVGALSYHLNRDKEHNERNVGFGGEFQFNSRHSIAAGRYKNSYFETSNFGYYAWTPLAWSDVNLGIPQIPSIRFGVLGGAVDGYRRNSGHMAPIALPIAMLEWRHAGVNISAFPHVGDVDGGIAAEFKLRF